MNYIQEMLLSQKEMLSMLMLGSRDNKEFRDEVEAESVLGQELAEVRSTPIGFRKEYRTGLHSGQRNWGGIERPEQMVAGYSQEGPGSDSEKRVQTTASMRGYVSAGTRESIFQARNSESRSADAKEMSRAIQRDARRYDGAFFIY